MTNSRTPDPTPVPEPEPEFQWVDLTPEQQEQLEELDDFSDEDPTTPDLREQS